MKGAHRQDGGRMSGRVAGAVPTGDRRGVHPTLARLRHHRVCWSLESCRFYGIRDAVLIKTVAACVTTDSYRGAMLSVLPSKDMANG
jgi:hypothetical protein